MANDVDFPSRRRIVIFAAGAFLALTIMANLAATLRQMHPVGGVEGSVTSLAWPLTDDKDAKDLLRSWRMWEEGQGAEESAVKTAPGVLITIWLLVDSIVFAPLVAWFLDAVSRRRAAWRPVHWFSWLKRVPLLAAGYLVFDLTENVMTAGEVFLGLPHWMVRGASGAKLVLFVLSLLPILFSFVVRSRRRAPGVIRLLPMVRRLRVPAVAIAVFGGVLLFLPNSVRPQLIDIMRTWVLGDDLLSLLFAIGFVGLLTAAVWASGVLSMTRRPSVARPRSRVRMFSIYAGVTAGVGLASWLLQVKVDAFSPAGWIVTVGLGLNLLLVTFVGSSRHNYGGPPTGDARGMLAALTAAPFYLLGLSYLSAANLVGATLDTVLSLVVAAAMIGAAFLVARWVDATTVPTVEKRVASNNSSHRPRAAGVLAGVGILALVLAAALMLRPHETGWLIGGMAMLSIWLTVMVVGLTIMEQLFWAPPRGLFKQLGFRRVPIVVSLVAVYLLAGQLDNTVGFHEARILGHRSKAARPGVGLRDVATMTPEAGAGRIQPLFVIAASGGGARAAYWTSLVVNCLFAGSPPTPDATRTCSAGPRWSDVLFASGISGGSVGLAMFEAQQLGRAAPMALDIDRIFADGFLDPTLATMLFVDAPNGLLRHDGDPGTRVRDRARTLEQSWERRLPEMKRLLFESQAGPGAPELPVLLLNSASVADGCRVNASVMDLSLDKVDREAEALPSCRELVHASTGSGSPDQPLVSTRDLHQFVCDTQDLRLSTAALLSARFPLVSPTGALTACAEDKKDRRVFAVDGGYVDSSAASTLVELIDQTVRLVEDSNRTRPEPETRPCVQPVVLQIDNGYSDLTRVPETRRPRELIAPLVGAGAARGATADAARQALEVAARPRCGATDIPGRRTHLHVFPEATPGIEAPLGWSLSKAAREDLRSKLSGSRNLKVLCHANAWMGGSCPPEEIRSDSLALGGQSRLPGGAWFVLALALGSVVLLWWRRSWLATLT